MLKVQLRLSRSTAIPHNETVDFRPVSDAVREWHAARVGPNGVAGCVPVLAILKLHQQIVSLIF